MDCTALAIRTPLGVVIHTGDFKVDPAPTDNELFDLHALADYGKRGVLLLLLSRDPVQHRAIVRYVGVMNIIFGTMMVAQHQTFAGSVRSEDTRFSWRAFVQIFVQYGEALAWEGFSAGIGDTRFAKALS